MLYSVQSTPQFAAVFAGFLTVSSPTPIERIRSGGEPIEIAGLTDMSAIFVGFDSHQAIIVQSVNASSENITSVPDALKFRTLAEAWDEETAILSSTTETVLSPAYQRIIGMGESALPFIFRQLEKERKNPNNWFWALTSITGVNPVPEIDRGDRPKMAAAWLRWGRKRYDW